MKSQRNRRIKKQVMKAMHVFCFLPLFFPLSAKAAAWLQPKGEGLVIGTIQDYSSCRYWNRQGQYKSGPCFHQFSVNPYVEYGLFSKFTVAINPNFNTFNQNHESVPFGFENIFLAGRYALWQSNWSVLSAQLGYNQPFRLGSFGNPTVPNSVYAIINRQHYIDARLLFGTGGAFDKQAYNTWYADFEAACQPNFNGAATELHFDAMAGLKTRSGRLVFELQELNTISLHNPRNNTDPNYNLFTVVPDVIYWYLPNKAAVQLGVQQDFYGNNIGQGTAPFIALWWKF